MEEQQEKKFHIGTIEGVSFILAILLLVVVFVHIIPELRRFNFYLTEDTQNLQTKVAELETQQKKLELQICSTNFDREISQLRGVTLMLNDLEIKGNTDVQKQSKLTEQAINDLINKLKSDVSSPAK